MNRKSKIHYASVERGNESQPQDEWSKTDCGLELEEPCLTDREECVTCKNCLRIINAHKNKKDETHNLLDVFSV